MKPPQNYIPVEAALPSAVISVQRTRQDGEASTDICEKKGVLGAGLHPKFDWVDAGANSEGLFTYFITPTRASSSRAAPRINRIGMGRHHRRQGPQEHRRGNADQRGGRQGAAIAASRARLSPATTR